MRRLLVLSVCALFGGPLVAALPAAEADFTYGDGWFRATCDLSHRAHDDPIVFPGEGGASHSHEFYGSSDTDADTTTKSLRSQATTCNPGPDRSAYWVPTLYENGHRVRAARARFYYAADTDWTGPDVQPFPRGLRIIAGKATATAPYAGAPHEWSCKGSDPLISSQSEFPQCDPGQKLVLHLDFPECWDGVNKDSIDHKQHLAYRVTVGDEQVCPDGFPVAFPRLQFEYTYKTDGGPDTTLASIVSGEYQKTGAAYTAHGDFWNAWDREALSHRVSFCLVAHTLQCDEDSAPVEGPEAAPVVDVVKIQPAVAATERATSTQRSRTTAFCRHEAAA